MKFSYFLDESSDQIDVYGILDDSIFLFGHNLNDQICSDFSSCWEKQLPKLDLRPMEDFAFDELQELMGRHEVIIRTRFRYSDGKMGEITLPYTPVFTLAQGAAKSS